MKVSIVIPSWNGKDFLDVCLISLRKQTFEDFNVVVVDNASTDNTVSFLESKFPEVQIIKLSANKGFSGAVNEGIKASNGEYIALLNQDTEVDTKWLDELVHILDSHPGIDFCTSKLMYFNNREIIDSAGDGFSRGGIAYKIGSRQQDGPRFYKLREVFGACAAAAIYRRRFFKIVGLFDDDLGDQGTDVDINFRAQLMGLKCYFVPTAIVYHHVGASTNVGSPQFIYRINRNAVITFLKNYPTGLIIKNILRIIALFLSSLWWYPHPCAAIEGRREAFRMLPSLLKRRKEIQSKRVVSLNRLNSVMSIK